MMKNLIWFIAFFSTALLAKESSLETKASVKMIGRNDVSIALCYEKSSKLLPFVTFSHVKGADVYVQVDIAKNDKHQSSYLFKLMIAKQKLAKGENRFVSVRFLDSEGVYQKTERLFLEELLVEFKDKATLKDELLLQHSCDVAIPIQSGKSFKEEAIIM